MELPDHGHNSTGGRYRYRTISPQEQRQQQQQQRGPSHDGEIDTSGVSGSEAALAGAERATEVLVSGKSRTSAYVHWGLGGVALAAEAVASVCDTVGAGPYLAVGYSMGGRVALAMAGRRPDLLRGGGGGGLVLVSSSPGLTR